MDPGAAATFDDGVRDDDVVSLAPSTSTLAGDEHPNTRGHRDSSLPRGEDPPSTSRSLRSGLSDGGSTRPFRASVSASAQTWRTRPLSLIVESDGTTSEWVLRVDAAAGELVVDALLLLVGSEEEETVRGMNGKDETPFFSSLGHDTSY